MCKYKIEYYDLESKKTEDYKCPHPAVNNEYCIFHHPNYWKDHEDEVREKLYELVESAITNEKPLYCIGFHLPYFDINHLRKSGLDKIEFKRPVYFIGASFNTVDFSEASFNEADFSEAQFNEADFKGATFNTANLNGATFNTANFYGAIFNERANFKEAIFNERAYFYETIFKIANFKEAILNIANFYEAKFNETVDFSEASFNEADFSKAQFNIADFKGATFNKTVDFSVAFFNTANFSNAKFFGAANFSKATFKNTADFTYTDFKDEVEFFYSEFNSANQSEVNHIPVRFDYATFRKRARFVGEANSPLSLEWVSLKGVDLTNVEFHNVKWREKKEFLGMIKRQAIIDEEFMSKNKNYEEVSKIYNQLRKNYESRLLFNEASNFFIGEMEAIRKRLWNGSIGDKIRSIPHILYKYIAMYGESYFLPLAFWTPIIIIIFTVLRIKMAAPDLYIYHKFIDSLAAYFQVPRSNQDIDIIERLISAPILGSAFIALRRKFERRK